MGRPQLGLPRLRGVIGTVAALAIGPNNTPPKLLLLGDDGEVRPRFAR